MVEKETTQEDLDKLSRKACAQGIVLAEIAMNWDAGSKENERFLQMSANAFTIALALRKVTV